MKFLTILFLFIGLLSSISANERPLGNKEPSVDKEPFSFLLASTFNPKKHSLSDYYLSEKLDGVRAYWDGKQLQSRAGNVFAAPQWFLDELPLTKMDGELWISRQTFDQVSGIVRRKEGGNEWRKITFMVFELPQAKGDFTTRYQRMRELYAHRGNSHWRVVEQKEPPSNLEKLQSMLVELDKQGGEGFMLKSKTAPYRGGRSDDLLKLKLKNDAEAKVIAHHKGKGRLANMMGSMTVEMPNGIRFKIGSGFTDEQRLSPPEIGSRVTYKYNGLTKNGKPRFPVFWRVRRDEY